MIPDQTLLLPPRASCSVGQALGSQVFVTKHHKLGGLKQQKCILSQLWRLEVQSQGVGRGALPLKSPGEGASVPPLAPGRCKRPLPCGSISPVSASFWLPSLCVFTLSSPEDSRHVGIRAPHAPGRPHLNPLRLQRPCYQIGSHSKVLRCRHSSTSNRQVT